MNKVIGFGKIIYFLRPPEKWRLTVLFLSGIFTGLGIFIVYISNAPSYLSEDPRTCINCHVMIPHYAAWLRSSHARNTTCNDCHVPHNNIINKYFFKAKDGMRHSYVFTFRLEPQVIRIKEAGANAVRENCIRCHSFQVQKANDLMAENSGRECWDCHRETPHGRGNSLSSTPMARL